MEELTECFQEGMCHSKFGLTRVIIESLYYIIHTLIASVTSSTFSSASCCINMITTTSYTHESGPLFATLVDWEVYDTGVPMPELQRLSIITSDKLTLCMYP